jgi:hypothetical protein
MGGLPLILVSNIQLTVLLPPHKDHKLHITRCNKHLFLLGVYTCILIYLKPMWGSGNQIGIDSVVSMRV